jgi:hypothetical protein
LSRLPLRPAGVRPQRLWTLSLTAVALCLSLLLDGLSALPARAASGSDGAVAAVFGWAGVNGTGTRSTPAFLSRSVALTFTYTRWYWAPEGRTIAIPAELQRSIGSGAWTTVRRVTSTGPTRFAVRVPPVSLDAGATDRTIRYRLRVVAGGVVHTGGISPSVKVRYQNVHRYTGFRLLLYDAARKYCPEATIHVMRLRPGRAGEQPVGLYELRISPAVRGYAAAYKRSVVLHECGHFLQYKNYGSTLAGRARMLQQADRIYGTNHPAPVEHMADCISHAVEPRGYLGYGGRCTAKQLRYAWRILRGHTLY